MFKKITLPTGLLLAATVGAGIFALPSVFLRAGWVLSLAYLLFVAVAIILAHTLFWEALHGENSKRGLLGLIKEKFGEKTGYFAFLSVIGGLVLTLSAYLILGGNLLGLVFPLGAHSLIAFWLLSSLPALFNLQRLAKLESIMAGTLTLLILLIFFSTADKSALFAGVKFDPRHFFLPFGVLLFSLAGWTSIEPIISLNKSQRFSGKPYFLAAGTLLAATLYFLFVLGIVGSGARITPDTISGLSVWPAWKASLLSVLGVLALLSVHWAISAEIKNSLERDYGWSPIAAVFFTIFLPIFLIWAGFNNFALLAGLVGGVFLAAQYLFIVLVSKKILRLSFAQKIIANTLILIFLLSAIYEIYYFIVK